MNIALASHPFGPSLVIYVSHLACMKSTKLYYSISSLIIATNCVNSSILSSCSMEAIVFS